MKAWTKALFIMYIALIFSCLIAFKMYGIRDFWTGSDKLAVTVHIFATLLVVLFSVFVAWFVIYKSREYINLKHEQKMERDRKRKEHEKESVESSNEEHEAIEENYAKFEAFFEKRDRTSYMAQYGHLVYLTRRIILVLAIIYIDKQVWSLWQIIIFWVSSLLVLAFNCYVKPYQSSYYDYVEIFNELVVLATGYFGTQLVMSGRSVEMLQQIGYALAGIITIFLTVSIIILAILMFKNIKTMILKRWSQWLKRRNANKPRNKREKGEIDLFSNKSSQSACADDEAPQDELITLRMFSPRIPIVQNQSLNES